MSEVISIFERDTESSIKKCQYRKYTVVLVLNEGDR